ncbi:MAG TPA: hypothetical protein VG795_09475 [Acidimicrobiia bacterium]|nr:hypothetical protein [Acidimicrobiia bacterium]
MLSPLVLVVVSLGLLSFLLFGISWFEQRILSPKALIVHAARARQAPPEHVEKLVARQSERLLQGISLSPAERAERTGTRG